MIKPIDQWAEEDATEFNKDVVVHLRELSSCTEEEIEDIRRCIMISLRQEIKLGRIKL